MAVGGDHDLQHSMKAVWRSLSDSPLAIIEHNIILFAINILMLLVIFVIIYLITLAITVVMTLTLAFAGVSYGVTIYLLPFLIGGALTLFAAGAVSILNLSAWAELTKSLRRRALPSAIKHFVKRILPI
jgi:hypothetical protein